MFGKKRILVLRISCGLLLFSFLIDRNDLNMFFFYTKVLSGVGIILGCIDFLKFKQKKIIQIFILGLFLLWSVLLFYVLTRMYLGKFPHPS